MPIPVFNPKGELVNIPDEYRERALDSGYRLAEASDLRKHSIEKKYGDSDIKAGLLGAARGATFGLSDWGMKKAGIYSEQELKDIRDANPISSGIGEVAGTFLPTPLGAGGAALKLGKMAGGALRAGKLGKAVASGAVSGGLMGAGEHLKSAAIGDSEFDVKELAKSTALGVASGGVVGGVAQKISDVGAFARRAIESPGRNMMQKRSAELSALQLPASESASVMAARRELQAVPRSGLSREDFAANRGKMQSISKAAKSGTELPNLQLKSSPTHGMLPDERFELQRGARQGVRSAMSKEVARRADISGLPQINTPGQGFAAMASDGDLGPGSEILKRFLPNTVRNVGSAVAPVAEYAVDTALPAAARIGAAVSARAPVAAGMVAAQQLPQQQAAQPQGPDLSWLEQYSPEQREQILQAIQQKLQTLLQGTGRQ